MLNDIETNRENASVRIDDFGLGAEFVRSRVVDRLRARMDALYSHGSIPDLVLLEDALRVYEEVRGRLGEALLTETLRDIFSPGSLFPYQHAPMPLNS